MGYLPSDDVFAEADELLGSPKKKPVDDILDRMRDSVVTQESGGNPRVKNARTSATGLFQVLPENIPSWTQKYLKKSYTPDQFANDPQAQEKVFRGEMGKYVQKALNKGVDEDTAIRMGAAAWYGGEGAMHRFDDPTKFRPNEPSFREYTSSILKRLKKSPQSDVFADADNLIGDDVFAEADSLLGEDKKSPNVTPTFPTGSPAPIKVDTPVTDAVKEAARGILEPISGEAELAGRIQTLGGYIPEGVDPELYKAYSAFKNETGMPDGPETVQEFNNVQKALANDPNIRQKQTRQVTSRPAQKNAPSEVVGANTGTSGGFSANVNWAKGSNRTAKEFALDEAASQISSQYGTDYDLTRQVVEQMRSDLDPKRLEGIRSKRESASIDFDANAIKQIRIADKKAKVQRQIAEGVANELIGQGETESVAQLKALKSVGGKTYKGQDIDSAIAQEEEAERKTLQGVDRRILGAFSTQGDESVREKDTERLKDLKQYVLKSYGSFTDYQKEQEELKTRYKYRPLAEPLEFAKNFGAAVPRAIASILKTGDIALHLAHGKSGESVLTEIGDSINQYIEDSKNKDFKDNFYLTVLPDTLGQLGIQIGAGVLTGGATVPTLIGASSGAAAQYDEAKKLGASDRDKTLAAIVGAAAAVPDAILFNKWFKGASGAEKTTFMQNFTKSLMARFGVKYGEESADPLTRATLKEWIGNLVKSGLAEGSQEVSENKINDLLAYATYDPSEKRKKQLTSITDEDVASFLGGFIGGAGGGAIETYTNNKNVEQQEKFLNDVMAELPKLEPEQQKEIKSQVLAEAKKRNIALKPLVKETNEKEIQPQSASLEQTALEENPVVEDKKSEVQEVSQTRDEYIEANLDPKLKSYALNAEVNRLGKEYEEATKVKAEETLNQETAHAKVETGKTPEQKVESATPKKVKPPITAVHDTPQTTTSLPPKKKVEKPLFTTNNKGNPVVTIADKGELKTQRTRRDEEMGTVSVLNVRVNEYHRKQGIATQLYDALRNSLPSDIRGIRLSDVTTSDAINVIYKKLGAVEDDGETIIPNPNFAAPAKEQGKDKVNENAKEPWEMTRKEAEASLTEYKARSGVTKYFYGNEYNPGKHTLYAGREQALRGHYRDIEDAIEDGKLTPEQAERLGHFETYPALRDVKPRQNKEAKTPDLQGADKKKRIEEKKAEGDAKRNSGTKDTWTHIPDAPDKTIGEFLNGRRTAVVGTMQDAETGKTLTLSIRPDSSSTGEYSMVVSDGEASESRRMMYKGGRKIGDILGHFEWYINTDTDHRFTVSPRTTEVKAPTPKKVLSPDEQQLANYKKKKYKTASDEKMIKILEQRIAADPSKWKVGDGVAYKVASSGYDSGMRRGFRIVEIDAENKQALLRQVADTGITSTGGDNDVVKDQWMHIGELKRDRKFDAPSILKKVIEPGDIEDVDKAQKADIADLYAHSEAKMTGENLELDIRAQELIRRFALKLDLFDNDLSFQGVTLNQSSMRKLIHAIESQIEASEYDGYTDDELEGIKSIHQGLLELAKQDFGIAYLFDESLPEETHHKMVRELGGISKTAISKLKNSPLWDSPKFDTVYKNFTDETKAIELAAKMETGQKYWGELDNFEDLKKDFLSIVADDIIDRHTKDGVVHIDLAKYERIVSYATEKGSKTVEEGRSGVNESNNEPSGETDKRAGPETFTPGQKEKLSKTPFTLRKGEIPAKNRLYTSTSNSERQNFANEQMDKGLDSAQKWAEDQINDNNLNAGATAIVGINVMAQLGREGKIDELNKFADKLLPTITDAAQTVQAVSIVSMFSPDTAGAYVTKVAKKNGKDVTPEQVEKATELAKKMSETVQAGGVIENALNEAKKLNEQYQSDIQSLEEALGLANAKADEFESKAKDYKSKLSGQGRTIAALRRQIEGAGKAKLSGDVKKKVKELRSKTDQILESIRAKYGDNVILKMVAPSNAEDYVSSEYEDGWYVERPHHRNINQMVEVAGPFSSEFEAEQWIKKQNEQSTNKILKMAADGGADQDLVDWSIVYLADNLGKITPEQFNDALKTLTNNKLHPDEITEIHAKAVTELRGQRTQMDEEHKAAAKLRNAHYSAAEKYNKSQFELFGFKSGNPVHKLAQAVLHEGVKGGKSDAAIWTALARKAYPNVNDLLKALRKEFPDMSTSEERQTLVDAQNLLETAKAKLRADVIQKKNEGRLNEEDIALIEEEKRVNNHEKQRVGREANRFYEGLTKSTGEVILETAVNFRRANLLSAIKTHFVNIGGNIGMGISEEVSRYPATGIDWVASIFTDERTTAPSPKGVLKGFKSLIWQDETLKNAKWETDEGHGAGIKAAYHVFKYGGSIADMERLQHSESILSTKFPGRPAKWMDNYINGVFKTLGAEDALFKVYAFRRHLEEQAKAIAITERKSDSSVNVKERTAELIRQPTNVMQVRADQYAHLMTFQNDNALSSLIAQIKRGRPVLKAGIETIMPYDRTPTNIVLRTLEYTPGVGIILAGNKLRGKIDNKFRNEMTGAVREDLKGTVEFGKLSKEEQRRVVEETLQKVWSRDKQEQFAKTMGRASLGTGIFSLGFLMAAAGLMTGAMTPDDDDRAETNEFFKRMKMGIENGSIYTPYGRIVLPKSPATAVLVAGASFYEQMKMSKKSPALAAMSSAQETFTDTAAEQPLVNSTYTLLRTLSKGKYGEFVGNLLSGFVPASAMMKAVSEVTDEKARTGSGYKKGEKILNSDDAMRQQMRGFKNSLLKGVPGARNYLVDESPYSVSDEERGGAARRFVRQLDPFNTRSPQEYKAPPPKR